MKSCPICALAIQDAAIKCRYCRNWIVAPSGGDPYSAVVPYTPPATSGLAIASMILGILWIYWIGSIVALVLGYLALREIRKDPQRIEGKGMAIAGIVFGWVGIATLILAIVAGIYLLQDERENQPSREPVKAALPRTEDQLVRSRDRNMRKGWDRDLFLVVDGFTGGCGHGPERGVGKEPAHKLGVQRVARFVRLHARKEGKTCQSQVANQVQGLVAAKFVREAEGAIHDAVRGKNDGIFE